MRTRTRNNTAGFQRSRKKRSYFGIGVAAIIAAFVLLAGGYALFVKSTEETVTITVTDKERITEKDSDGGTSSKYLIFTDSETFENTDSTLFWKFNSSDVYG